MPKASATIGSVLDELLAEACERNAPAELVLARSDGLAITARVRFLKLIDDEILADKPGDGERAGQIPLDRSITVHLVIGGVRYQFDTVVVEHRNWVELNSEQLVPGIVLRKPSEIARSERRADYRVSLAGISPIDVEMVRGDPDVRDACLWEPGRIGARMLNISAGGVALLATRRQLRSAKRGERYFLSFDLADADEGFCVLAEIRQVFFVEASDSLRLALAFREWGGRHFRYDQRRITKFITEQQRRLLRMRK